MRRGSTLNSIEKNEIPVMISVRGEQYFDGVDPDATELMTEGTLETTDTGLLLRYRESELTGMEGTETTFEIGPRRVILRRSGSVSSQMVFEEGQQHTSLYETPYGELTVDIQTLWRSSIPSRWSTWSPAETASKFEYGQNKADYFNQRKGLTI